MTLLYADGFEDGLGGWANSGGTIVAGRFGSGLSLGSTSVARFGTIPGLGPWIFGFAYYARELDGSGFCGIGVPNSDTAVHVGLARGVGGEVGVYNGNSLTPLAVSATNVIPLNTWVYVEVKLTVSDAGIAVVRVNGVEVINASGIDTFWNGIAAFGNSVNLGYNSIGGTSSPASWFDDFYIVDNTGSTNNDFIGETHVEHLRPNGDTQAQWLGSDGDSTNNYALVNEVGVPVTTSYVESQTVGQTDLYNVNVSSRPITNPVAGVVVAGTLSKTDVGTRTTRFRAREGFAGADRLGTVFAPGTGFAQYHQPFDRKADGSTWLVNDANNLRIGIEVTG